MRALLAAAMVLAAAPAAAHYEIHIQRKAENGERVPIPLAEWRAALAKTKGARFLQSDVMAAVEGADTILTAHNYGGDAVFFLPDGGNWTFFWTPDEGAFFNAPAAFDEPGNPVRRIARDLAGKLHAEIVGDEGEEYK